MNEFVIKNGFISKGDSIVEGGLTATTISATTYSNLPSSPITVGTTQITSGTSGRVFFQSGTTLQQDGAFNWDNTNKRLGIGANATSPSAALNIRTNIAVANDILTIQNGFYGNTLFRIRDNAGASASLMGAVYCSSLIYGGDSGVTRRFDLGGFGLGASFGDSGANAVWENNQGNIGDGQGTSVIAVSSNFYVNLQTTKKYKFEAVTGNFGIGNVGTLGARLDVRSQGALSTDIAFRVRNSADNANIMEVAGNNNITILSTAGKAIFSSSGNGANLSMRRDFSSEEMIKINAGDFPSIEVKPINTTSHISVGTLSNGASTWWDGVNYNFQIKNSFHNLFHVVGNPNSATATFRIGTIASNTNFFNVHGRNAGGTGLSANPAFTINSSGTVGIGTEASTPGARLDVRAQGALSTDIAFRVRNSTDTVNMFYSLGNGTVGVPWGDSYTFQYGDTSFGAVTTKNGQYGTRVSIHQFGNVVTFMGDGGFASNGAITLGATSISTYKVHTVNGTGTEIDHIALSQGQNQTRKASVVFRTNYNAGVTYDTARLQAETYVANSVDRTKFNFWASNGGFTVSPTIVASLTCKGNLLLGTPTEDINDSNTIYIPTGTTPTSGFTSGVKLYSANITTGNAVPHFRTENGSIVKLYQETTGVAAATLVGGGGTTITDTDTFGGYTLQQIAQVLKNLGILQ